MGDDLDIGSPLTFADADVEPADDDAEVGPAADASEAGEHSDDADAEPAADASEGMGDDGAGAAREEMDFGEMLVAPVRPREKFKRRSELLCQHARGEREKKNA